MLEMNNASSSSFPILPVETSKSFQGPRLKKNDSTKSESLVTTMYLFFDREFVDNPIRSAIAVRKVKGVNRFKFQPVGSEQSAALEAERQ